VILNKTFSRLKNEILISRHLSSIFRERRGSNAVILTDRCDSLSHWHIATCLGASIVGEALEARVVSLEENGPLKEPPARVFFKYALKRETVSLKKIAKKYKYQIEKDAKDLFLRCSEPKKILAIHYKGLRIGPEIYDGVLKHKLCTVRKIDKTLLNEIRRAVKCIICLGEIFKKYKVIGGFCTHTTCSFDGVWLRYLLHKGLPVYQGFGGMESILKINPPAKLKRYELQVHVRPPRQLLNKNHPAFRFYLKKGSTYLNEKFKGNSKDWDAKKAFSKTLPLISNRYKFAKKYCLNPSLPNVFIMLHAMNDDPHVKNQYLFDDYYDWFQFSLARLGQNRKCNWIFKIHPRAKDYPDDADIINDIKRIRYPHIKVLDENELHAGSISHLADVILTAGGTAALEYVAHGIPSVIVTRTGYHGYGLVREPKSLQEYEKLLVQELPGIKKPNKETQNMAIVAYYLYNNLIRNKMMNGFFSFEGNSEYIGISSEETCKKLLSNLTLNKEKIMQEKKFFIYNIKKINKIKGTQLLLKSDFSHKYESFKI